MLGWLACKPLPFVVRAHPLTDPACRYFAWWETGSRELQPRERRPFKQVVMSCLFWVFVFLLKLAVELAVMSTIVRSVASLSTLCSGLIAKKMYLDAMMAVMAIILRIGFTVSVNYTHIATTHTVA